MADSGGILTMAHSDDWREEFADRLGISVEVAATLARDIRPFSDGEPGDLFGRFRALLRKAYERQEGMRAGDFDRDVKNKHVIIRSGDAQLLLRLFADDALI